MDRPFVEVGLLGVVQGLTEFLPVSSDGHLALGQMLFGIDDGGLALSVVLHAGTWLATVLVLWRPLLAAVREGTLAVAQPRRFTTTLGGRDALLVVLATLPTGVIGLLLRHSVESLTRSPLAVGLGFVATTLLLASTRFAPDGTKESPTWSAALLIGVAQGLAALPGVSRSGATICLMLWLGVRKDRAFELSMLISLPAVLGAVLLEAPELAASPLGLDVAVIGVALAFGVGLVALIALRGAVVRGHFPLFAAWTLPLAVATLAMARAWPS